MSLAEVSAYRGVGSVQSSELLTTNCRAGDFLVLRDFLRDAEHLKQPSVGSWTEVLGERERDRRERERERTLVEVVCTR